MESLRDSVYTNLLVYATLGYLCTETEEGLGILIKRTPGKNLESKTEQKFLVALEIFVNMHKMSLSSLNLRHIQIFALVF